MAKVDLEELNMSGQSYDDRTDIPTHLYNAMIAELKAARKEIIAAKKLICEIAELISDAVEITIDKAVEGAE